MNEDENDNYESLISEIRLIMKSSTSMGVWGGYNTAKILLREIALEQYKIVTEKYIREGYELDMPTEGFKEISNDITNSMRTIAGWSGSNYYPKG